VCSSAQENIIWNIFWFRDSIPTPRSNRWKVNFGEKTMSYRRDHSVHTKAPTRRQAIFGAAIAFGGLALISKEAGARIDEEISRSSESIHQEPVFKASRKRIYEALTQTDQFNKVMQLGAAMRSGMSFEKAPTQISPEAGGAFSLFGGYVVGRNIEVLPSQRLVQAWRAGSWEPGLYSIAKFELVEQGSGTKIIFDHTGFPTGQAEHLAAGWKGNYWEPLERFLA
jgi:activator of HSP90 ATPase